MVNVRSFGENPQKVSEYVAAFVRGVHEGGALATAKHFPGHGDTIVDSHITLPVLELDRTRLNQIELAPFRAAISAGVDSIMTAHIALPQITGDRLPASISPYINTELLRRALKFDGIITTDSLGMHAITERYTPAESALRAIKAGADVALLPPDPRAAIDAIEAAVQRGEITEERINESVRRLLRAKYRVGLARERTVDLDAVNRIVEEPESVREADSVAERGLTLLRNQGAVLPLDPQIWQGTLYVIIAGDADYDQGRVLQTEIEARVKGARLIRIDGRTTPAEYEQAMAEAMKAQAVVVAPFIKRAALKGTVALPDAQAAFVRRLVKSRKPVAVIAFGSPYQLQQYPEAGVYLVTYAVEMVAQRAAARALFGETAIRGRAPVSLPGLFKIGDGLRTEARSENSKSKRKEALPHN
jgi:beta-N-acetylhexosaminidase